MTDFDYLIEAAMQNKDDDGPRLALSDAYEMAGDTARAEFVRLQIQLHAIDLIEHTCVRKMSASSRRRITSETDCPACGTHYFAEELFARLKEMVDPRPPAWSHGSKDLFCKLPGGELTQRSLCIIVPNGYPIDPSERLTLIWRRGVLECIIGTVKNILKWGPGIFKENRPFLDFTDYVVTDCPYSRNKTPRVWINNTANPQYCTSLNHYWPAGVEKYLKKGKPVGVYEDRYYDTAEEGLADVQQAVACYLKELAHPEPESKVRRKPRARKT